MITVLIIAAVLTSCSGANESVINPNILPSNNVVIADQSHVVSVERLGRHMCCGTVVGSLWTLTSARCVFGMRPRDIVLRAGTSQIEQDGFLHPTDKIIVHPQFDNYFMENDHDIALVKVRQPMTLSDRLVRAIPMATMLPRPGTMAIVSGYRVDNTLTSTQVPIVSHEDCKLDWDFLSGPVTDTIVCAGYRISSNMDGNREVGSPLVFRGQLIGFGMWVPGPMPFIAKIYTNIVNTNIRAWIYQNSDVRSLPI